MRNGDGELCLARQGMAVSKHAKQMLLTDVGVALSRGDGGVTEKFLDYADVGAVAK